MGKNIQYFQRKYFKLTKKASNGFKPKILGKYKNNWNTKRKSKTNTKRNSNNEFDDYINELSNLVRSIVINENNDKETSKTFEITTFENNIQNHLNFENTNENEFDDYSNELYNLARSIVINENNDKETSKTYEKLENSKKNLNGEITTFENNIQNCFNLENTNENDYSINELERLIRSIILDQNKIFEKENDINIEDDGNLKENLNGNESLKSDNINELLSLIESVVFVSKYQNKIPDREGNIIPLQQKYIQADILNEIKDQKISELERSAPLNKNKFERYPKKSQKENKPLDFFEEKSELSAQQASFQNQLKLTDKKLQNQMMLITHNVFGQFDKITDSFIKTAKFHSPEIPDVIKINENNKLITMLNEFLLYLNAYFKVDFPKSKNKRELEENLTQNLKEILGLFQILKKELEKKGDFSLKQEIDHFEKIIRRQVGLENILSLKKLKKLNKENDISEQELNQSLSDFMGNFINGIAIEENLRASIENSDESKIWRKINDLKMGVAMKLKNVDYSFKVKDVLPFFLELINKKLLNDYYDFMISLIGRIDLSDFRDYSNGVMQSNGNREEILVLFCEWVDDIHKEKNFLL